MKFKTRRKFFFFFFFPIVVRRSAMTIMNEKFRQVWCKYVRSYYNVGVRNTMTASTVMYRLMRSIYAELCVHIRKYVSRSRVIHVKKLGLGPACSFCTCVKYEANDIVNRQST